MSVKNKIKNSPLYPLARNLNAARRTIRDLPAIIANCLAPKMIALLYHRVANLDPDIEQLSVTPEHFEAHLKYLKDSYRLLSLTELIDQLENGKTTPHGIILTFDDGYCDNFTIAYPILKKLNIPAVIFVAGSGTQTNEWWWDELEHALYEPLNHPSYLTLPLVAEAPLAVNSPEGIEAAYRQISQFLKSATLKDRDRVLAALAQWRGWDRTVRSTYQQCSPSELRAMSTSGLIEIGGHTNHHPQLSSITAEDQRREISENLDYLKKVMGQKIRSFAYPFGSKLDINQTSIGLTKKFVEIAFTTTRGQITPLVNRYTMPRYVVKNWPINEFKRKINTFFLKP